MKSIKLCSFAALTALAVLLTSCATPPPRAFQNTDNTALVIQSMDAQTCRMIQPTTSADGDVDKLLAAAAALSQHQTAVVILENYTDPKFGDDFRDRGTPFIVGLKELGYQRIVFLRGAGVASPDGLNILVEYN
jgi:hypothetical protein